MAEKSIADVSEEWKSWVLSLLGASSLEGLLSRPDDPRLQLEMYRWVLLSIEQAYEICVTADPDFPVWSSHFVNFPNASHGANPDTLFLTTVLQDSGVYRIWGTRGTSKFFSLQIGGPLDEPGNEGLSRTFETHHIDQLTLGPNREFEVMLSPRRPAGWTGDWWSLPAGTGFAFARQVAYDWVNERHGELHIERLNPSRPRPLRKTEEELRTQLQAVFRLALGSARRMLEWVAQLRRDNFVNRFRINTMQSIGGWGEQRYWECAYEIGMDEALVVAIDLPEQVAYWNVQLSTEAWESLDHFNRISSINGMQARCASDGRIYVVVANEDPGVPNWLDTGRYNTGHLYGRWNNASAAPLPTIVRTAFKDVRMHLPADTPVVSPEERSRDIAVRRRAAQRLFRY